MAISTPEIVALARRKGHRVYGKNCASTVMVTAGGDLHHISGMPVVNPDGSIPYRITGGSWDIIETVSFKEALVSTTPHESMCGLVTIQSAGPGRRVLDGAQHSPETLRYKPGITMNPASGKKPVIYSSADQWDCE